MTLLSLVDTPAFLALVEGFAAFGSVIAVVSGFWAFVGWASFQADSGRRLGERIADAVNYGIVFGFLPGCVFAVWVFHDAYRVVR